MDNETLVKKLSCDFVMADPDEPETLTGLLPVLKAIHSNMVKLEMTEHARNVLKAKNTVNSILKDNTSNVPEQMDTLEVIISDLAAGIHQIDEPPEEQPSRDDDGTALQRLEDRLDIFAHYIGGLCKDDPTTSGQIIEHLDELAKISKEIDATPFYEICMACREYLEQLALKNRDEKETVEECLVFVKPIEECRVLLKSMMAHLKKGEAFTFDYSDVIELLKMRFEYETLPDEIPLEEEEGLTGDEEAVSANEKLSADDLEILNDFVSEALENLDTIEVSLIELEQDPENKEIINDIFRPFHTIKGVSGFLSLTKINHLSHTTENLLDGARDGDFIINQQATDAILTSVDTLKALIDRVKHSIQTGYKEPDDDIDIEGIRQRLKQLQTDLAKGEKPLLGDILVEQEVVDRNSVVQALEIQKASPDKKIGEILVTELKVKPEKVAKALMDQGQVKKRVDAQVKVSTQKLDDLVDYAGELVIAQSMLRQKTANDASLTQNVAQLGIIVSKMQNISMSMRMIPIKSTFMKMIRLVRDLARKSGKSVDLKMIGEETEIDRNVVDALYEPMVHMIRNSVDHGIETVEDRQSSDKPEKGTITLRAYHKGGHIVIEIEDDGKGLDKVRILEKAQSTGLITGEEQMTDAQIYDLIMQPGFSTAKQITDVSGRGVGMDVVKDGIEKFRGQLNIESQKGKGTKFTISLPLTLAIIDGMLVRVDKEKYVIPTTAVQKAYKPAEDEYFTVEGKGEMVKDRGSLVPLIRLSRLYNSSDSSKSIHDSLVVVVESKDEKRALLIDELLGKEEYVIKNLGGNMENIDGIAGGAILSDGRVGLILDVHGIFNIASNG